MYIFISYSRSQFNFVDTLAAVIQDMGHQIWFDVEQLAPGENWKDEINEGLSKVDTLILIASHDAITSENVLYELETAQKYGKVIHVVLYERVKLPQNLSPESIIIGWRSFNELTRNLKECLNANNCKVLSDNTLREFNPITLIFKKLRLSKFPNRIKLISTLFAVCTLWAFVTFLQILYFFVSEANFYKELIFPLLVTLLTLRYLAFLLIRFSKRRFVRFDYYLCIIVVFLTTLSIPANKFENNMSLGILICVIMCIIIYPFNTRLAVYHWLERGIVSSKSRQHYRNFAVITGKKHKLLPQSGGWDADIQFVSPTLMIPMMNEFMQNFSVHSGEVPTEKRSIKYHLYYAVQDKNLAVQIINTMTHFGHILVESNEFPERSFLIVSENTSRSMFSKAIDDASQFILILASSVVINEDTIRSFQWVDYRSRSQQQLNTIAAYFANPEKAKATYGLNHVPQPMEWRVIPIMIAGLENIMRNSGAFFCSLSIFIVFLKLAGIKLQSTAKFTPENNFTALVIYTFLGFCGFFSLILSQRLINKKITSRKLINNLIIIIITYTLVITAIILIEKEINKLIIDTINYHLAEGTEEWFTVFFPSALIVVSAYLYILFIQIPLWLPEYFFDDKSNGSKVDIIYSKTRWRIPYAFFFSIILIFMIFNLN